MERESVASSNIASIGYDAKTEELEIEFLSGSTYRYLSVAPEEYQALMDSPSIGTYFARFIKPMKSTERID